MKKTKKLPKIAFKVIVLPDHTNVRQMAHDLEDVLTRYRRAARISEVKVMRVRHPA